MSRVLYVRNPAAHGGAVPGVWDRFLSQWPGQVDSEDVMMTHGPGHARDIAASAKGYDFIILRHLIKVGRAPPGLDESTVN